MTNVSAAQARLLRLLGASPIWFSLTELDLIRSLEDDDVLCVPSLVEHGWVEHRVALKVVRISPLGQIIAAELGRA